MATSQLPSWADKPSWILNKLLGAGSTHNLWGMLELTYAFPAKAEGMENLQAELFAPIGFAEKASFVLALGLWDDAIAASIKPLPGTATSETSASLEFGYFGPRPNPSGYVYVDDDGSSSGSIWINRRHADERTFGVGGFGFKTLLHEIGHTLGLEHPGEYNTTVDVSRQVEFFEDSSLYTVMSYVGPGTGVGLGYVDWADWVGSDGAQHRPQTPMIWDVRAAQAIYGASRDTRTGDTLYGFGSNITGDRAALFDFAINRFPILTIVDSGGVDTLDVSGFTSNSMLDLRAGASSDVAEMTRNVWIADGVNIENARTGSGHDVLGGNALANRIDGGAGDDRIDGREGDDTLVAGPGNDLIEGGAGEDTAVFAGALRDYRPMLNVVKGTLILQSTAEGTDTLSGVEWLNFSDERLSSEQLMAVATTVPALLRMTPVDDATRVPASANLMLEFSETVKAGAGYITVHYSDFDFPRRIAVTDTSQVRFDGPLMIIDPRMDLARGSSYYVTISDGAVVNASLNAWEGIADRISYSFSVTGTNRNPTVAAATATVAEDSPLISRLPAASDADGDALIYRLGAQPAKGSASVAADGSLRYQPDANFSGRDNLAFEVIDAMGGRTSQVLTIDITDVMDTFVGTEAADTMAPFPGRDIYQAGAGDDRIRSGGGDDVIDGGPGIDTLVLDGVRASFQLQRQANGWTVSGAQQGGAATSAVERLAFSDHGIALDIVDGHAGQAAKLINALFGRERVADLALVGKTLSELDAGTPYPAVIATALASERFEQLASSRSNTDFVRWVYQNVVGQAPGNDDLAWFVGLLESGAHTQQTLALLAADHALNEARVDLVGLAETGLAYLPGG